MEQSQYKRHFTDGTNAFWYFGAKLSAQRSVIKPEYTYFAFVSIYKVFPMETVIVYYNY